MKHSPTVVLVCGWVAMGLLLASAVVVCERSEVVGAVDELPAEIARLENELVVELDGLDDQEVHVSQPSAERVDNLQQDQRFPLHRPVWYRPLRLGFSLHTEKSIHTC